MKKYFTNGFTQFIVDGVDLHGMQIANPKLLYDIADASSVVPRLTFDIRRIASGGSWKKYFDSPEVGYFERDGKSLYRNCNIICNLRSPEIFYRGRVLPNSYMRIAVNFADDKMRVDVEVTANYLRESRSRFTRNLPFDETINNVALVASIRLGYLPLHAAAINIPRPGGLESVAFMGYPNTGKTTTSVGSRKLLRGEYLAEDICFYSPNDRVLLSGPFTLDEIKIQDYSVLRSERFFGGRLSTIVMLSRADAGQENSLRRVTPEELERFVVEMNRYEFEWNHDSLIRGLFIGGQEIDFDNCSISRAYAGMMHQLSQRAEGVELRGCRPEGWADELACFLSDK